jgi:anti-anti-sigma regulatory factor
LLLSWEKQRDSCESRSYPAVDHRVLSKGVRFMSSSPFVVDLGSEPGIRTVAILRDQLSAALAAHDSVAITASSASSIDVSILQLLASAHRTAMASGKALHLRVPQEGPLRHALIRAGFISSEGLGLTREGDFWTSHPAAKDEAA